MKTVFIINPKAGQGNNIKRLIAEIEKNILSENYDAEIYVTKCVGDAKSYVNDFCKKKGPARFIACGGDGTLSEVVNGAFFYEGVQIGVIPIGTGNDFCRNFSEKFDFSDIRSQFEGKAEKCDVIYYKTKLDGEKNEGYCINMINIGFDCNVADMSAQMKKKPFISGSMSYFLSIFACMIKKKGADFSLEADGKKIHSGRLLLASVANGSYCGGGIKSNPLATVNDGVMNMNVIKNIKRMQFIPLLPPYMKGKILEVKNIGRYLTNMDCRKIRIKPNGRKMRMCIDGEIIDAGDTTLEVIHNAIEFVGAEKAFCNVYDVNNKTLNM